MKCLKWLFSKPVLILQQDRMNLDVSICIISACSHPNYRDGITCGNELHRYRCCFFAFPIFQRTLNNPQILQYAIVVADAGGLEPLPQPLTAHLYCYFFKNFPLLFCYPFSLTECKGTRLFSLGKIIFKIIC
jgi:hypothetical protein